MLNIAKISGLCYFQYMPKTEKRDTNFFISRYFLIIIALFLFVLILSFFFGDSGIIEIVRAQKKIENLENRIKNLEIKKAKLEKEIKELKNNPLALEKRAREKLWLMKKNEKVIVIIKNKKKK